MPNYDLLQNVFHTSITRRNYKESDAYDWEKEGNGIENESVQSHTTPSAAQQQKQSMLSNLNNKVSM
jgi:hypothetical protein